MGNSADRVWQLSQLVEGVLTACNPSQGCPRCVSRSPEARFRVVARAVLFSQPAVLSALLVIQLFGIVIPPPYFPKEHQKERCGHSRSQRSFITFHGALWNILLSAGFPAMFHMMALEQTFVNALLQNFFLLLLLNRIDSIPASEKAGTLYLRIYPYVDPDKITTMFLFATSPLLSQSGNAKSSIKGNALNSDSLNRKSPCSSSLYKRRHCLPSVTAQTRLLLFNKYLWLHKQKIKSHYSSARSAISLASLTARASWSLFSSPVFCSIFATWNLTVDISQPISAAMRV